MITVGEEIRGVNLHELAKVNNVPFVTKLVVLLAVTAVLTTLTLQLPGVFWVIPSLLLGLAYAHAVELQHQCLHSTAFRARALNRVVGVIVGLPSFVSYSDYQNSHLKHHRLLGTPEDKEFFNYSYQKLTTVIALIPHLWMVRHYRDVVVYICKSIVGKLVREKDATLKMAKKIRFEYQLMGVFALAMVTITVYFQTPLFLKLWLVPFLVAIPAHALIELPEHMGCNTKVTDVLQNTRTIMASKLAVWFVDGNNYHVEHHWLPGVPNDKFPRLHQFVSSKAEYLDESYWSFYRKFFKNLASHNLHRPWQPEQPKSMGAAGGL